MVLARRPPSGVYHFLSLFAVSHQFSQRPSCHLSFFPLSSSLGSTRFASRTPSVFLSFFLYNTLSFPLYFPGKTAWKSSNFWL